MNAEIDIEHAYCIVVADDDGFCVRPVDDYIPANGKSSTQGDCAGQPRGENNRVIGRGGGKRFAQGAIGIAGTIVSVGK
jgi:hypothetical protein